MKAIARKLQLRDIVKRSRNSKLTKWRGSPRHPFRLRKRRPRSRTIQIQHWQMSFMTSSTMRLNSTLIRKKSRGAGKKKKTSSKLLMIISQQRIHTSRIRRRATNTARLTVIWNLKLVPPPHQSPVQWTNRKSMTMSLTSPRNDPPLLRIK